MKIGKFLAVAVCGGLFCACAPAPPSLLNCKNLPANALDQTRAVQQALADRGYHVDTLDGRMNGQTMEALWTFQRDMGVPTNGQADAQTLAALGFCAATSPSAAAGGCENFPADRREQLRVVQRLLNEQGYDPGPADGYMGPKTVGALKRFQANNGLSRTGKIDGMTREAMGFCGEAANGKPASATFPPPVSRQGLEETPPSNNSGDSVLPPPPVVP